VFFDVPYLAGVDLRPLSWQGRRERLALLAVGFEPPYTLVPVSEPNAGLPVDMEDGKLEGVVLKVDARKLRQIDDERGG
jgi:ATP-dependent DNA ligase